VVAGLLVALRLVRFVMVFRAVGLRLALQRVGRDAEGVHCIPVGCDQGLRDLPDDVAPADPP
jgi:hypothetical protein